MNLGEFLVALPPIPYFSLGLLVIAFCIIYVFYFNRSSGKSENSAESAEQEKSNMKIKSVAVSLSLVMFVGLSALILAQTLDLNRQIVFAEEARSSCPLPENIAVTFLDSQCEQVELLMPQTFFRYYDNNDNQKGRYLTTDQYHTNVAAITNLALNQDWGNKAEKMLSITLPAGTTVYQGVVAPQNPASCYPGGGQQTFIEDSRDPNLFWTEGPTITKQTFTCP